MKLDSAFGLWFQNFFVNNWCNARVGGNSSDFSNMCPCFYAVCGRETNLGVQQNQVAEVWSGWILPTWLFVAPLLPCL